MSDTTDHGFRAERHPLLRLLTAFPVACFCGALATDLAYVRTMNAMWADFSTWLLAVGMAFGGLAALVGLVVTLARRDEPGHRFPWAVAIGSVVVLALALLNNFVHSRDAWTSVMPERPDMVARAIAPDCALSSHVAPLGMVFGTAQGMPARYHGGAFVGEHGSWNRPVLNGYKVVFVPFTDGKPSGTAEDVVTGFLDDGGHARGRPVGLGLDRTGALLVADDVGNAVWRVTASKGAQAASR